MRVYKQEVIAVEKAWSKYQRQLLSFIRSKVKTSEDAEDILHDVFTKLIKQTNYNNSPKNITSWLYAITKNCIVDYYRTMKIFEELPQDLSHERPNSEIVAQLSRCMVPMIKALPSIYQQPLMLADMEGIKQKQVAKELGLSLSAIKSRLLRGREKLYKNMIICCTVYRNSRGQIIDYTQNLDKFCSDCED